MDVPQETLPPSVTTVTIRDKTIYLVGTAHVSKESVLDVLKTVDLVKPDSICVELCESRYKSIMQPDAWKNMDIFKVIKENKAVFLLAQLLLTSFYRRLGQQLEVKPGAEMIEGIRLAKERGVELVLADRNIEITLKRVWGFLNFWNKIKMSSQLLGSFFITEKIDAQTVEGLKSADQLENVLADFAKEYPEIKRRLIDERDAYLASKIAQSPGKSVVAVVGAGHIAGIRTLLPAPPDIAELITLPPKSIVPTIIGWSIPAIIVILFVIGFFKGGAHHSYESIYIWVLVTGGLSALGAAAACAHPLAIIASFIAAPFTTLHPLLAAGWFSGLVQAWIRKPTVHDMEELPEAIASLRGFWKNPVSRILLVVALANIGSSLGTFIAGGWIAKRIF